MLKYLFMILILFSLNTCYTFKASLAMNKSTRQFLVLADNPQVLYEKGSESNAVFISTILDDAIRIIVERHYSSFPEKLTVYLPNTVDSFADYCASQMPRACVIGGRLFLSPRLFKTDNNIPGILMHELSHLHLTQSIGRKNFQRNIPAWFAEGLAVWVSGGGGAEQVTKEEARAAICEGKHFIPDARGSLFFPHTAHDFNLSRPMFYQQAGLFVEWLHDRNEQNFKNVLSLLSQGINVGTAIYRSYGISLEEAWHIFVQEMSA